ncbi:hypothetical protein AHF37_00914 [Paragonimus kellicotti]|nr:hypothetical protein AHF37_00914 [Paragonimus kellicotti]
MACLAENMNASQFFFTLGAALELTGKHTLFGKVAGETLFNMLRLGEGDVGSDERPHRLHRIVNTKIAFHDTLLDFPRQTLRPDVILLNGDRKAEISFLILEEKRLGCLFDIRAQRNDSSDGLTPLCLTRELHIVLLYSVKDDSAPVGCCPPPPDF